MRWTIQGILIICAVCPVINVLVSAASCDPLYPSHVFYNRIPKAGSSTLKNLAHLVAKHSDNLTHVSSRNFRDRGWFAFEEEKGNAQRIVGVFEAAATSKVIYDQHVRYIDFRAHGLNQPVYINMVREPTERVTSSYYFARFGGNSHREQIRAALGEQADWNINQCVEAGIQCKSHKTLSSQMSLMTEFFCGHHPDCQQMDSKALERAKSNLEKEFLLVGLTEEFSASLTLLERLLPDFFMDARKRMAAQGPKNINRIKPEPLTEVNRRRLLAMGTDEALYSFARDLFHSRILTCLGRQYAPKREISSFDSSLHEATNEG
eukprot:m.209358 g.209358  ORF g.209358 m.209358 type:complete len:320 (+) comp17138_c1_seq1:201-1160(+)